MDPNMDVRVELIDEMYRLVWPGSDEVILDADTDEPVDEGGFGRKRFAHEAASKVRAQYDYQLTYE